MVGWGVISCKPKLSRYTVCYQQIPNTKIGQIYSVLPAKWNRIRLFDVVRMELAQHKVTQSDFIFLLRKIFKLKSWFSLVWIFLIKLKNLNRFKSNQLEYCVATKLSQHPWQKSLQHPSIISIDNIFFFIQFSEIFCWNLAKKILFHSISEIFCWNLAKKIGTVTQMRCQPESVFKWKGDDKLLRVPGVHQTLGASLIKT